MGRYVNVLVDKSFLQSLSRQEAKWLFHLFHVVCPNVLFEEILADVEKAKGSAKKDGLHDISLLAAKIDTAFMVHQERWEKVVLQDIFGRPLELDGRPMPEGMVRYPTEEGTGVFIDQTDSDRPRALAER